MHETSLKLDEEEDDDEEELNIAGIFLVFSRGPFHCPYISHTLGKLENERGCLSLIVPNAWLLSRQAGETVMQHAH